MVQNKEIVFEVPKGMSYTIAEEGNKLIIRLIPDPIADTPKVSRSLLKEFEGDKSACFIRISRADIKQLKKWVKDLLGDTIREQAFLELLKEAVLRVDYEYWIATIEPSVKDGEIFYEEGEEVGVGYSAYQWRKMAKEYFPQRGSRVARLSELLIWYGLRIMHGSWTLGFVANDSSESGSYWNAPNSLKKRENSGARVCGGFRDGQGNTSKIVMVEGGYALVGGDCFSSGDVNPVADIIYDNCPNCKHDYGCAVVVLTKNDTI